MHVGTSCQQGDVDNINALKMKDQSMSAQVDTKTIFTPER